jgi:hypothetical protein
VRAFTYLLGGARDRSRRACSVPAWPGASITARQLPCCAETSTIVARVPMRSASRRAVKRRDARRRGAWATSERRRLTRARRRAAQLLFCACRMCKLPRRQATDLRSGASVHVEAGTRQRQRARGDAERFGTCVAALAHAFTRSLAGEKCARAGARARDRSGAARASRWHVFGPGRHQAGARQSPGSHASSRSGCTGRCALMSRGRHCVSRLRSRYSPVHTNPS